VNLSFVIPEPLPMLLPLWALLSHQTPEASGMIQFQKVGEFMDKHIIDDRLGH
jgi:hypothetical protein